MPSLVLLSPFVCHGLLLDEPVGSRVWAKSESAHPDDRKSDHFVLYTGMHAHAGTFTCLADWWPRLCCALAAAYSATVPWRILSRRSDWPRAPTASFWHRYSLLLRKQCLTSTVTESPSLLGLGFWLNVYPYVLHVVSPCFFGHV